MKASITDEEVLEVIKRIWKENSSSIFQKLTKFPEVKVPVFPESKIYHELDQTNLVYEEVVFTIVKHCDVRSKVPFVEITGQLHDVSLLVARIK